MRGACFELTSVNSLLARVSGELHLEEISVAGSTFTQLHQY